MSVSSADRPLRSDEQPVGVGWRVAAAGHFGECMKLTSVEADAIAKIIDPIFFRHESSYSFKKYPAEDYARYKSVYSKTPIKNDEIQASLVWKWGHFGKNNFPLKQKELIQKIKDLWADYVRSKNCGNAKCSFQWWSSKLPSTAYITAAYVTHLVHHSDPLPIIDQHNFRAMNRLVKAVRAKHEATKVPRSWQDIAPC
jgi:hypothetical protein